MMMEGSLAVTLNALFVSALTFLFAVGLAFGTSFLSVEYWRKFSAQARRTLLCLITALPWLFSVGALSFALLYLENSSRWGMDRLYHWHHTSLFDVMSWHGVFVAAFVTLFFTLVGVAVLQAYKHTRSQKALTFILDDNCVLPMERPLAFTAGLFAPKIFVSQGLLAGLTEEQKVIVLLHEKAHVQRRDPIKKWLFCFMSAFYPKHLRVELRQEMALCMEQCADEAVVAGGKSPEQVARAILQVSKRIRNAQEVGRNEPLMCSLDGAEIKERVHYLLLDQDKNVLTWSRVLPLVCGLFLLSLLQVDLTHHIIEVIFKH